MENTHFEVVITASFTRVTITIAPTMNATSPAPGHQPNLEHQHKDNHKDTRSLKPIHPLHRLPSELKTCIFDHLDPIDSTSLGLSSRHMYPTYRRKFPKPLPLGHIGEGVWALEWNDRDPEPGPNSRRPFCWKCGTCPCRLHRHIQDLVGRDAFNRQITRRWEKMGRPRKCPFPTCVMGDMGFERGTRRPCGCYGQKEEFPE